MADLYLGLVLLGSVAIVLFAGALWLGQRSPLWLCDLLSLLVVVSLLLYIRYLWYDARLVSWLPYSNLIVIGNWLPLGAGLLGGLAWRRIPGRVVRKAVWLTSLSATAAYSAVLPLLGDAPACRDIWNNEAICMQTTANTCTPACAATLLKLYGIETTEQEMAQLCLTRKGTTWLGLYHGLKCKTRGTRWDVEVLSCDANHLLQIDDRPTIAAVGLSEVPAEAVAPNLTEWGWRPGQFHSVLLLERKQNKSLKIADPTPGYGVEHWSRNDLRVLFQGMALRLVERS